MMSPFRSLLLPAILLQVVTYAHAKSKYVSLNLETKWRLTPTLLEASEFLAMESNDKFWRFVDAVASLDSAEYAAASSEQSQYALAVRLAQPLLSPLKFRLFKFALSLRTHSPAIQMYRQIALDKRPHADCEVFVEVNNMITCEMAAMTAFLKMDTDNVLPALMKRDHFYLDRTLKRPLVVLYAQLATPSFKTWYLRLCELARDGAVNMVLRHYVYAPSASKVGLSGYGIELAIKNTEYKAKDDSKVESRRGSDSSSEAAESEDEVDGFLFTTLKRLYPELQDNLTALRQHLIDGSQAMAPLKVWQLQDLSIQAAQLVVSAPKDEALPLLRDISQNFPLQARTLIKTTVQKEFRREMEHNKRFFEDSLGLSAGDSALFLNGLPIDMEVYDIFTLLDIMKTEATMMEGLHTLGLPTAIQSALLKLDLTDGDSNYAVDIRHPAVQYVNDLETDRKYAGWPTSLQDLLRPTFPGMLRHIRKNLFHAVFLLDPANSRCGDLIRMAEAFYVHNAPLRIGLVFVVNSDPDVDGTQDAGVALLRAFNFVKAKLNIAQALSFLTDVLDKARGSQLTPKLVEDEFNVNFENEAEVFGEAGSQFDSGRKEGAEFLQQIGVGLVPQVLINGVPMKQVDVLGESFEEAIVTTILRMTSDLQSYVTQGALHDGDNILDFLMTRSNVVNRLNVRVMNMESPSLDFTEPRVPPVEDVVDGFENLPPAQKTTIIADNMQYLTKKEDGEKVMLTNWVIADLDSPEGRLLAYEAIKQMKVGAGVRVGFLHNPRTGRDGAAAATGVVSAAVHVAMETLPQPMAKSFVAKLLKEELVGPVLAGDIALHELAVHNMDFDAFKKDLDAKKSVLLPLGASFCKSVLRFQPGESGVVTNGRIIGPFWSNETFILEDFSLLEKVMVKVSASKIFQTIEEMSLDPWEISDYVMKVSTLLMTTSQKAIRKELNLADQYSAVVIPAQSGSAAYDLVAILDPASRAAQKYTPLLMVLQQVANVNLKVYMNCREKLSEMPLKSFYRYVLEPELRFVAGSGAAVAPTGLFLDMPEQALLTLAMDAPESWLVESVRTRHDLDNIYLTEIDGGVDAHFELEHLLLEGHCYDAVTGQPPRGLQFILGTNSTPALVDTIVMANLGYFQLKATAGSFQLRLRPGRSGDIYTIASHELTDSPPDSSEVIIVMDNFKTKIIKLKVAKQQGQEREDLLGDEVPGEEKKKGLWDSISSTLTGGGASRPDPAGPVINIFSVASGHLYERFLKIMMLSVLRHTKSKVKFWFLKNYLSPSFKEFIPHMARQYGFQYELVQYKWPRWLHQQTEKQRIIWGYKILFLDVLFPLNLEKFIFVDADLIVRADLQELIDMDLQGAPYAYTPFCESRKEMDGFRFWKSGYWANHLAGRKYHISALYVVDLKRFRRVAAGDRLRGQYQGLSQDPNSLSNLDQDLPNNMIHQVALKSLPQEWLWCETWCSDKEKSKAKAIDLCNNPLTKEPKLEAAMRIVPEWKGYDDEARAFSERVSRGEATRLADNDDIKAKDDSHVEL